MVILCVRAARRTRARAAVGARADGASSEHRQTVGRRGGPGVQWALRGLRRDLGLGGVALQALREQAAISYVVSMTALPGRHIAEAQSLLRGLPLKAP